MAAVRHWGYFGPAKKAYRVLGGLYHCAQFGNDVVVSIFGANFWKTPIHTPRPPQKWGFGAI